MAGRPSKLTPTLQQAVVEVLRNTGCNRTQAARHIEVDRITFGRWIAKNESFRSAVEKAENDYDLGLLGRARAHAAREGKTAQWLIEHHPRLRAEWGTKAELTVVGPDGLAPSVEVKHTHGLAPGTADSLAQLSAIAASLDVMVRVGLVPQPGGSEPRLVNAGALDDAEDDEVHPA